MKKIANILFVFLAVSIASCGPKPEDACNCLQKSANDYMLSGYRPSDDDLLLPCAEYTGKFKDDQEAQVKLRLCVKEVKEHIKDKKLFAIDGVTPEFPVVTTPFDSVISEFKEDQYAAEYKYRHRKVTIDLLLAEIDSTSEGEWKATAEPVTFNKKGELRTRSTMVYFPVPESEASGLISSTSEVIFDKKRMRSIKFDDRWYGYGGSSLSDIYYNVRAGRREREEVAHRLEDQLRGKSSTFFGDLRSGMREIANAGQGLAEEVKAGNYILLSKKGKHWIGDEYGKFYFNRLKVEGELKVRGFNGYKLPVFDLENSQIVSSESLLELPSNDNSTNSVAAK